MEPVVCNHMSRDTVPRIPNTCVLKENVKTPLTKQLEASALGYFLACVTLPSDDVLLGGYCYNTYMTDVHSVLHILPAEIDIVTGLWHISLFFLGKLIRQTIQRRIRADHPCFVFRTLEIKTPTVRIDRKPHNPLSAVGGI